MKLIKVDMEAIRAGRPGEPAWCPIAVAIRREVPHGTAVWVDGTEIQVGRTFRKLPEPAYEFMLKYDRHQSVEPFEFDLDSLEVLDRPDWW